MTFVCLPVSTECCMKRAILTVGYFLIESVIISNVFLIYTTAFAMEVVCFDLAIPFMALGTFGCYGIAMVLCELIDSISWRWR